jgi:hypothetical protein
MSPEVGPSRPVTLSLGKLMQIYGLPDHSTPAREAVKVVSL